MSSYCEAVGMWGSVCLSVCLLALRGANQTFQGKKGTEGQRDKQPRQGRSSTHREQRIEGNKKGFSLSSSRTFQSSPSKEMQSPWQMQFAIINCSPCCSPVRCEICLNLLSVTQSRAATLKSYLNKTKQMFCNSFGLLG